MYNNDINYVASTSQLVSLFTMPQINALQKNMNVEMEIIQWEVIIVKTLVPTGL